jgi:hypothetical protein
MTTARVWLNAQREQDIFWYERDDVFSLRARSGPSFPVLFSYRGDLLRLDLARFWQARLTPSQPDVGRVIGHRH